MAECKRFKPDTTKQETESARWLHLLQCAKAAATQSLDPNTKLGCVIVDRTGAVAIEACNTFIRGIAVTPERLERPAKYTYIEHAERNACFSAAKRGFCMDGCTMVMSCNPVPCAECARAIVQSGVKRVVGPDMSQTASSKWDTSCSVGEQLLTEAGVILTFVDPKTGCITKSIGEP